MESNQRIEEFSIKLQNRILEIFEIYPTNIVIVQGDTTTALVGGMAAFYRKIPVAHVEAGLRTGNVLSPFPEEFNRKTLASICSLCFAPTWLSAEELYNDNVMPSRVKIVGNTVIDAVRFFLENDSNMEKDSSFPCIGQGSKKFRLRESQPFVLVTAHRRESFGLPMKNISMSVRLLSSKFPKMNFIIPVHKNPNVRQLFMEELSGIGNVYLVDPIPYLDFLPVLSKARLILSDSGGIQEESSYLNIPILIMRESTERLECILAGKGVLMGTDSRRMIEQVSNILSNGTLYKELQNPDLRNIFGNGNSSSMIAEEIEKFLYEQTSLTFRSVAKEKALYLKTFPKSFQFDSNFVFRKGSVALILTVYKRDTLGDQIVRAKSQTVTPTTIIVFQNENHVNVDSILKEHNDVKLVKSAYNFRHHGRFAVALLLPEEYVIVWDDDIKPGKRWIENTIRCVDEHNAICGDNGRFPTKQWEPKDTEVRFVGHSWAFKRKWLSAMFSKPIITTFTSEDHELSAYALLNLGVRTFVTAKPVDDPESWADVKSSKMHSDKVASYKDPLREFYRKPADIYLNEIIQ